MSFIQSLDGRAIVKYNSTLIIPNNKNMKLHSILFVSLLLTRSALFTSSTILFQLDRYKLSDITNIFYSYNLVPVVLNELFFYPTPNNFNYFYCVGFLLGLLLCFQFMTGVLLACYYIPKVGIAFTSIDYAIRDVAIG